MFVYTEYTVTSHLSSFLYTVMSGNTEPQSSQLAEPLWTKELNLCVQASLHFKKIYSTGREWMVKHSPKMHTSEKEATTTTTKKFLCLLYTFA